MERGKKLASLLKSREAEEYQALQETMRIDKVLSEREKLLSKVEEQIGQILSQIQEIEGPARGEALQSGDATKVASLCDFVAILHKKVAKLQNLKQQRKEDLESAKSRMALAQEELLKARVERKKIETLMAGEERSRRLVDAAIDESEQDDLISHHHTNK